MPSQKKKKVRNYEKIITNPKFKEFDAESCGSAYFKDWEFTNEELDIRDLIKKAELRKKRQEKRKRKQISASEEAAKKKANETIDRSEKDEELDKKDEADKPEADLEDDSDRDDDDEHQKLNLHNEIDGGGEVSSVASSIYSQTRSYFSLRNAIEEKFVSLSIKNLKMLTRILFLTVFALQVSQFII